MPIIASINCVTHERWADYAKQLESAGADGLEINIGFLPNDSSENSTMVEERYERILHAVRTHVSLPLALKVGPYISSFAQLAERLGNDRVEGPPFTVGWCGPGETEKKVRWRGADALVLFNRFYRLDIDVDSIKLAGGNPYSTSEESHLPLRWISLLAGRLQCDLAATTLYQNGLEQIGVIIDQMQEWMLAHNYQRLDDFRGQLSQAKSANPDEHERMQYIKALVGIE